MLTSALGIAIRQELAAAARSVLLDNRAPSEVGTRFGWEG